MPESGRWVEVGQSAYGDHAVFCLVTGVRLQRRYWETADGHGPYASPEAVELAARVERLRERWPDPVRFDPGARDS
jgi:hypothetical protein